MLQRVLAASAFSFFILAGVLFWEAYRASTGQRGLMSNGRIVLLLAGGMVAVVMGVIGTRARHRRLREDEDRAAEQSDE